MASKQAQKEFIIEYLAEHGFVSALDQPFHEEFHDSFEGKIHVTASGLYLVNKAQRLLTEMFEDGSLVRRQESMYGLGNPKWLFFYSLPDM